MLRAGTFGRHDYRILGMFILAFAVAVMVLGGDRALANHVACGDTITADTTLDSDLVDCPDNGIVIGADDITLDLNGHRVNGDGTEFAGCRDDEFCDVGLLNDGHDGVTVKHGSTNQFAVGAFVGRSRHSRVVDISSSENTFFGFVVAESARSAIRKSAGSNNVAPEGDGLGLFGSHHIRIVHNSFRHNPGPGIHAVESTDNLIKRNVIARNSPAILMEGNRNRVLRNRCARNDAGIIVAPGNRNIIARNHIIRGLAGIGIEKGRRNVVARNVVAKTRKVGIYLGLDNPPIGGRHTIVRRNRVRGTGGDAFVVRKTDRHSRLNRNLAVRARRDGFDVKSPSATLAGNRAFHNADLGIEAVRGVIDGGGNIARANGDPRQCTGVFCA